MKNFEKFFYNDRTIFIKKVTNSKSKVTFVNEKKVFRRKYESSSRRVPSITKARALLGFKPEINLEEGLKRTIAWTKGELNI